MVNSEKETIMSTTNQAVPNGPAEDRLEMGGDETRMPYHAPRLLEYGSVQELTRGSSPASTIPDGPSPYGADRTPGVS
jgi:hypothetical protein